MNHLTIVTASILVAPVVAQTPSSIQPPPTAIGTAGESSLQATPSHPYLATDYTYEDLPPKVQEFLHYRFGAQTITDIDREMRNGFPVWEIEFKEPGRNQEIHVDHQGIFIPGHEAIVGRPWDPTIPVRPPLPAAGTPPGTETGSSFIQESPVWESLPELVRQRALQFGGRPKVTDIDWEVEDGLLRYEIEFKREGWNLEIDFAEDGSIIESNDPGVPALDPGILTNGATSQAPVLPPRETK
jgi:uncharacterized membrane protein YkoI